MKGNITKLRKLISRQTKKKSPYYNSLKFQMSKLDFVSRLKRVHGITLEKMNAYPDRSIYLIPNTKSALMIIPGPTNPTRHIPEISDSVLNLKNDGYSLYVVFVRESAWPTNTHTFAMYKSNSRRISSIRGLKGVLHRNDFHIFYDDIISGKKISSNSVEDLMEVEAYKTVHADSSGNVDYESLNAHYRLNSKLKEYI